MSAILIDMKRMYLFSDNIEAEKPSVCKNHHQPFVVSDMSHRVTLGHARHPRLSMSIYPFFDYT